MLLLKRAMAQLIRDYLAAGHSRAEALRLARKRLVKR